VIPVGPGAAGGDAQGVTLGNRRLLGALALVAAAAALGAILLGRGGGTPSPRWTPLPRAPIRGRLSAGAVWTGTRMIVWGGVARSGAVEAMGDGAAYDPATRTWRELAPAPPGVLGDGGTGVVWTGRELLVWASNSPDGPVGGAVYDPRTNRWRGLPAGPLGRREGYQSAWTGREMLVISGTNGDTLATPIAAALDPATGSWRLLPALNAVTGLLANGAVWGGHEVYVTGRRALCPPQQGASCGRFPPVFLAYDPVTDALRSIALSTAPLSAQQRSQLAPVAWTGTEVILATTANRIVRYDPATGAWHIGRPAPCAPLPEPTASYTQTAWLGGRYVAACGTDRLQLYTPATDAWRVVRAGPSPLNSRFGSAVVWTGSELIVWSGTVYKRFNPTPRDGASVALAASPR